MKQEFNQFWKKKKNKFYSSTEWKKMRRDVVLRDKNVCQKCGKIIFSKPNVHHVINLTPKNIDDPNISLNPDNLITICEDCHNKEHGKGFKKEVIVNDDLTIDYSKR